MLRMFPKGKNSPQITRTNTSAAERRKSRKMKSNPATRFSLNLMLTQSFLLSFGAFVANFF